MDKDRAIAKIRELEPLMRRLGVSALYLFGSTARNEALQTSDIDLFFDPDPAVKIGLLEFGQMERALHETLQAEIDLCTRASLHPVLKPEIERTAVRVL
ncbi:nucleotidyltransferase domain-containing protein [Hyphomicrobium sp. NDB2Meth4]|uniref:nucleotidyltransferase family protein n=1 Tax=Hyphomicrobium sp. NDB2Meth4 TaxID=1892846 RepID=UPI0009310929|nr:nucleotidyltransferase domain-containing protein [Hyphomicrobium sp. NDB2Meth4]